ncbi:MAG: 6-bladed beta-propeller, partial [Bacteroidales bacterium]|nr:6-bladed beta-propeller [Bacteroidales bacterium]
MGRRFCFSLCMLMLCVCAGCSSSVVSDDVMRIDVGEALDDGQSVGLSRYGSAIEYVPLESVPQSLLREGSSIFYDKGKFFIVSHFLSGADDVPFFDESGKYLGRVGKAGRGPGEYNQL